MTPDKFDFSIQYFIEIKKKEEKALKSRAESGSRVCKLL